VSRYKLHQRLGYRASRLARIMQNRLEAEIAEHGLTRLMWCVMTGVGEEGVRTPSELAEYVGVTRPTISRLLRVLEEKGMLRRTNGELKDGRSVRLELTPQGEAVTRGTRSRVDALNTHFTAKLAPEHLAVVLSGLEILAAGEDQDLNDF